MNPRRQFLVEKMATRAQQKGWWLAAGLMAGLIAGTGGRATLTYTSTDTFCSQACHAHPHATQQWTQAAHYANTRGVVTHCVDCHLPPSGPSYLAAKVRLGTRDLYGQIFLDVSKIDWARERKLDRAARFTYDSACIHCHSNLFGQGLSRVARTLPPGAQQTNATQLQEMRLVARRMEAHVYYQRNRDRLRCINCHLFEGHRQPATMVEMVSTESSQFPLAVSGFQNYTQAVPGSSLKFHMIAVPAGTVEMGSPELGACRQRDTGPVQESKVKPFWMAQATVGRQDLVVFYAQAKERVPTTSEKTEGRATLTQQVARRYADWLSLATGKVFRLPTEAELEYACIAGGVMPVWRASDSRADLLPGNVTQLNSWGFAQLPDPSTEFTLDYPSTAQTASWPSDVIGTTFRVVREWEQTEQRDKPSTQLSRR